MLKNKKVTVVMPAYNAAKTLEKTYKDVIDQGIVDHIILVDDASTDDTVQIAKTLPKLTLHVHPQNRGYGGNQKTLYRLALADNADIVIMVHPDYQYDPKLIPAMAGMIASGIYQVALASRILGGGALRGGMPLWKYTANRGLTLIQNLLTGAKLSEYHTGYRAFSRELLLSLPLETYSNDFVFDNQILNQVILRGHPIGEITCPTKYFPEASSINFSRSCKYGIGCVIGAAKIRLAKCKLLNETAALSL